MIFYFWLFLVFVSGAMVGSFLNVAIARLPLEKSMLWPGSRCGNCFQAVRWYDNLPLISYWWLGGRCRVCGSRYSIRYFLIELLTALGFVGLFYLEVVRNLHGWPPGRFGGMDRYGFFPLSNWLGFVFHAVLFSFLLVASVCDLIRREIPLRLTVTGTLVGLVGSVLFPWPWPWDSTQALPRPGPGVPPGAVWLMPAGGLKNGLYPWPVWGPLPEWLPPGSWQLGLATGLAGALAGTVLLRLVGFLFSTGLGKEALGLGDADLMMMAGAFLGWQPVVIAFFISVIPGMVFGVAQMIVYGDNRMPFGPSLSAGVMLTVLGWGWLGPQVQPLFFWASLFGTLVLVLMAAMLGSSFLLRLLQRRAPMEEESQPPG